MAQYAKNSLLVWLQLLLVVVHWQLTLSASCGNSCTNFYINCGCFTQRSSSLTADSCLNIHGYYDVTDNYCYYNEPLNCTFYWLNGQCYSSRSTSLTPSSCSNINGYFVSPACYFSSFNCVQPTSPDGQCFSNVSATYTDRTCDVIGGYYDNDMSLCYFNTFSCPSTGFQLNGQCYTYVLRHIYTSDSCDSVKGYFDDGDCYFSGYCRQFAVNNQCYRQLSDFDCESCRLVDGFIYTDGHCYHSRSCTYYAINGQCYRNQSTVSDQVSCSSLGRTSYWSSGGQCYYTVSDCPAGQLYSNCNCYLHESSDYSADTCSNIAGSYSQGVCYYNSSYCQYYAVDGQCLQRLSLSFTKSTCQHIGGVYYQATNGTSTMITGCYYNTFMCNGYPGNDQCYGNRSLSFSRSTCSNIGGYYGYLYDNGPSLYCMYETFNCSGMSVGGQCHTRQSGSYTADSCVNVDGYFNDSTSTCFFTFDCQLFDINNQCYSTQSPTMTCDTCKLINGYYNINSFFSICFYSSTANCPYFIDGQCYTLRSQLVDNMTSCNSGVIVSNYCYYNPPPPSCSADYYHQCRCFGFKSTTMTVDTCDNINGFWLAEDSTCYYTNFTCRGYAANGQCYSQVSTSYTAGTCFNINGYFLPTVNGNGICFYYRDNCYGHQETNGGWYNGQCYSGQSNTLTCETCANIAGLYDQFYGCLYYTSDCPSFAVNGQCYTNRVVTGSSSWCAGIAGYYSTADSSCYYTPHNCSTLYYVHCQCYALSSATYTSGTCRNIGGHYSDQASACFYNTQFHCIGFWYQDQCYAVYNVFFNATTCPGDYDATTARCYIY